MSKPKSISDEEEVPRIDEDQFLLYGEIDPEFSHLIHFQGSMLCFVCKEQTTYAVEGEAVAADTFSDAHVHPNESAEAIGLMPDRLKEQIVTETSPDETPLHQAYVPEEGEEIVQPDLDDDEPPPEPKSGKNDGDVVEIIKF